MQFNKKILHVLIVVCLLFLSLTVYLTYFVLFPSAEVAQSPYDRRSWKKEDSVMRGTIYDKDGEKLAYSQMEGDTQVRVYPYGGLYTHVIGFHSRTYGKSQLELKFNDQLIGEGGLGAVVSLADRLAGGEKRGADLHLTIDHDLQSVASAQLGKRNGAVVAMNPKTGAVEVMVSTPTYDPSAAALKENWPALAEREDAPFLNRATSGLYAPGSTFKVVTAAAAIEQNLADETFMDKGSVTIGGKEFVNQGGKVHGEIDVTRGFALSSNVVFTQLAAQMGADVMQDAAGRFGLNRQISFDLPTETASFPTGAMSEVEVAAAGIGQGKVLATPLSMAMIAASVANDGVMMNPYLVDYAAFANGVKSYGAVQQKIGTPITSSVASVLQNMMAECVKSGTGTAARVAGLDVYGKTGTAENERGKDHSWFIGYCEDESGEQLAVAIILEYNGQGGGAACAPIAQKIFAQWAK